MRTLLLILMLIWSGSAASETVGDPTAPPPNFKPNADSMYPLNEPPMQGGLQGIIGANELAIAIINGQMVRIGDYYGAAKLIEAANGRAVLQSDTARQVLYLHGKQRWVSHIQKPAPRPDRAAAANSAAAFASVNIPSLRVRAGADANAAMIGGVKQGDRLEILGRQGDWLRIHKGRLRGFVHRDYVTLFSHSHAATASDEIIKKGNP